MTRNTLCLILLWLAAGCAAHEEDAADMMSVPAYADSDCGSCALSRCQNEAEACGGDPGCERYQRCLLVCPKEDGEPAADCATSCAAQVNTGWSLIRKLNGCLAEAALSCPCGKPQPPPPAFLSQSCPAADPGNPDLCARCENAKCCETYAAYKANCRARCIWFCGAKCIKDFQTDDAAEARCRLGCAKNPTCNDLTDCTPTPAQEPDALRRVVERLACLRFNCPGPGACATPNNLIKCVDASCQAASLAVAVAPACYLESLCAIAENCRLNPACYAQCAKDYPGCGNRLNALVGCARKQKCE